ncbi:MAG: cupin domain-containing protein [Sphingomicrobium sp.]
MHRPTAGLLMAMLAACAARSAPPATADQLLPSAFEAGWKGQKVCEPLFENEQMRAARCTFPPGIGHERHYHPPHWGYIVQGTTMRITTASGTTDRILKAGTNWWSDGIEWHEAINVGATTGVYVIIEPKQAR